MAMEFKFQGRNWNDIHISNRPNRGIAIVVSAPRITADWVESLNGINARLIFSLYPRLI